MDAAFSPVWPDDNSEAAALVRAFDWSRTSLGPIASWPQSLRTTVEIVLASPIAMVLMCGPDHVMIYNDSYSLIAGKRHPAALGGTVPGIWPEIWENWNRRIIEAGFRGETLTHTDQQLQLLRNGVPEDVWFDLYYTPTRNESGEVFAVLCTVVEITAKVLSIQRQQRNEQQLVRLNEELRAQREAIEATNRKLEAETDFLRDMFQHAPSFIAVLRGPDHVFELVNEPYQRLIGDREVLGRPIREVMPEVAEQGFVDLLDRVYRSGEPFVGNHVSVLLRGRDHEELREHILDFVYQPIRAKDGSVVAIFVEGTDATERASAEERLHIAQKAGGIGAFEWFPETGEVVITDEFRRIWNLPADADVNADSLVSLVLPEDRDVTGPALLESSPNPLNYTEYRIRDPQTGVRRRLQIPDRTGIGLRSLQGREEQIVLAAADGGTRRLVDVIHAAAVQKRTYAVVTGAAIDVVEVILFGELAVGAVAEPIRVAFGKKVVEGAFPCVLMQNRSARQNAVEVEQGDRDVIR